MTSSAAATSTILTSGHLLVTSLAMQCLANGVPVKFTSSDVLRSALLKDLGTSGTIELPFDAQHVRIWQGASAYANSDISFENLQTALLVRVRLLWWGGSRAFASVHRCRPCRWTCGELRSAWAPC